MRISSSLFFQTGLNSINAQQSDLMHLYQQIGSGQRMVTPADDPLAAAQAINISQSQSLNKRFADNREVAYRNLGTEENTLNSVTTLLQDVKTRLVEAGNGTLSDQDRATLANVLASAKDNLLGLANATDGSGQYLFSGAQGGTPAYQLVGDKIVYKGDGFQRNIQADQTRQIPGSDVGSDVFNRAAPGTTGYLSSAHANGGTAVVGKPIITDPDGHGVGQTFTIRFTSETTYEVDVTDSANNPIYTQTGGAYDPAATKAITLPGGVQVDISGKPVLGDKFTIEPITAPGYTAYPNAVPPNSAVIGVPRVTDSSAAIPTTGYLVTFTGPGTYEITPGPTSGTYNPATTNVINLGSGLEFDMSGTAAAGQVITIAPTAPDAATNLNVFETLDSIIAALSTPNATDSITAGFQNALATAMQRIDVNYNNVLTVRASVGARMNELDAMNANGAARALSYSSQLSKLEDVDYYSATAQLQLRTSALEAAALAFRKIQATSLFNMGNN